MRWSSRARARVRRAFHDSGLDRLNVRWRFRIVVMTLGIPFLGYIVWAGAHDANRERQRVWDRAHFEAKLAASRFDDDIEQIDHILATLSTSMEGSLADRALLSSRLQNARSYVPASVDNMGVWSLDGFNIGAIDQRPTQRGVSVADRAYFKSAIAHRDLAWEGPILSRSTGTRIIQFARPVFGHHDDVAAVITIALRSDDLVNTLDPDGEIRKFAVVTIVDAENAVVSRSTDADAWIGKAGTEPAALAEAFRVGNGVTEETGVDQQRRLVGFARVGSRPWMVRVAVPNDAVTGPAGRALLWNLGSGLMLFGIAFLVAGRVATWTTAPLMQLAADTDRLGDGELAHRSQVVTGGEVGTLAHNFNRMAAALEKRERQLAASQTRLRAVADNIPEHITYLDREERIRYVNAFAGAFPAHAPQDMVGRTLLEVRGQAFYDVVGPIVRAALAGREHSGEISVPVRGRLRHFHVRYVPDRARHGEVIGVYAFAQDITERKDAELSQAESEKRLAMIADNVPAMICYLDLDRRFRFANRAFEYWFRRPLPQIIGQTLASLIVADIAIQYEEKFDVCIAGQSVEFELEVLSRTRRTRWVKCNFIPDFDESGGVRGVYGLIHDVTGTKEAEARLIRLARFDTLTGLANRHQFNEALERVLDVPRTERPVALMFLDIDHFKQVNDRYGHGHGDALLKEFAERLAACVRPIDVVARLSGDEFVVLLEGMHSEDEPQFIARKIIAAVEKPFVLESHRIGVTTSIGIALRSRDHEAASDLMKRADEALYDAKRAGRNTFRLAG